MMADAGRLATAAWPPPQRFHGRAAPLTRSSNINNHNQELHNFAALHPTEGYGLNVSRFGRV